MAGTSNITGDESIIFADNASFDGTERGGKMTTNGQLWIGSTVAPHVRLGNITAGAGVTISNSAGNIQVAVTGGAPVHGTGTDNHIVRWDGTGVPQIQDGVSIETDTGEIQAGNGAVGTPAFTFVSDTGTGIYRQGAGNFSAASAGNEIWRTTGGSFITQQVLQVNGGTAIDIIGSAISLALNTNETVIYITDTSAARTVTLPASPGNGQIYIIKDSSGAAATNAISVTVSGGVKTIDGLTTQTISSNYGCMWVQYFSTPGAYFIL